MSKEQSATLDGPRVIYVWFADVPDYSPGDFRIRKWDTKPFPEGKPFVLSEIAENQVPASEYGAPTGRHWAPGYPLETTPSARRRIPEGWKLVPVEMTPAMIQAAMTTPGMKEVNDTIVTQTLRGYPLGYRDREEAPPLQQAWKAAVENAPEAPNE